MGMASIRRRDRRGLLRQFKAVLALELLRLVRQLAVNFPAMQPDRFLKLAGSVDGYGWAPVVSISGREFGRSMSIPAIERIHVDGKVGMTSPHELAPVATTLFAGFEPFDFNVSFACGKSRWLRPGPYGNPNSPWFNVFFGYYELDVDARLWGRPFGYSVGPDGAFRVSLDDLTRLIHADWNYFSNYMYGVPLSAIARVPRDPEATGWQQLPRTVIGEKAWDRVLAKGTQVCSAYLAGDGAVLVDNNWILNDIWRASFGQPYGGAGPERPDDPPTSFFPTRMSGELLLCWDEYTNPATRELTYRTFIFGGSVNDWWADHGAPDGSRIGHNSRFLAAQLATVATVIEKKFPKLGFSE
jgi:hypothetical protein